MSVDTEALLAGIRNGEQRSLARAITAIENQAPGYRELVGELHADAGDAHVLGITGSPGAGKSTLVEQLIRAYRDRGESVGVIAIDPSSPYSGGAVLGDRVRMSGTMTDSEVFVRSMSARGTLGGLSPATTDAIRAISAAGFDHVLVETVGAGQNEIDVVRAADTVAVVVTPSGGDIVQTLKAGILEIADLFLVNKADRDGADQTVNELQEMLHLEADSGRAIGTGEESIEEWMPPVLKTTATQGDGIEAVIEAIDDHSTHLHESGQYEQRKREQYAEEIRRLLRSDINDMIEARIAQRGGIESLAAAVVRRETDPYSVADELLSSFDFEDQS